MIPTLTFAQGELSREVVRLGDVVIGDIAPYAAGRNCNTMFSLRLPDTRSTVLRPARSFKEARAALRKEVSEWFLRAGIFYPGQLIDAEFIDRGGHVRFDDPAEAE